MTLRTRIGEELPIVADDGWLYETAGAILARDDSSNFLHQLSEELVFSGRAEMRFNAARLLGACGRFP